MMKIKILFTDQPLGFDIQNNAYINALRKKYEVEFSDQPDIVFFSVFGDKYRQYKNSIRIFLANEPVYPNFNDCDYAIGSMDMKLDQRYFRQAPILNYGEESVYRLLSERRPVTDADFDREFCNFIYSNATKGSGAKKRIEFCRQLQTYRHVDCPGRVLNNMDGLEQRYDRKVGAALLGFNGNWADSKLAFIGQYKFTVAFENISMPGWTTEKLIHPLIACSIPVYWGSSNASEYFNPKAFIDCTHADSFAEVIERVKELDQDKDRYLEMLRQPVLNENYPVHWEDDLVEFLARIVEGDRIPFEKNPMGYTTVNAQDHAMLCREGKMGMREILHQTSKEIKGWMEYKMKAGSGNRQ